MNQIPIKIFDKDRLLSKFYQKKFQKVMVYGCFYLCLNQDYILNNGSSGFKSADDNGKQTIMIIGCKQQYVF